MPEVTDNSIKTHLCSDSTDCFASEFIRSFTKHLLRDTLSSRHCPCHWGYCSEKRQTTLCSHRLSIVGVLSETDLWASGPKDNSKTEFGIKRNEVCGFAGQRRLQQTTRFRNCKPPGRVGWGGYGEIQALAGFDRYGTCCQPC